MPSLFALFRPRCWSGKNSTRSPRSNAHCSTAVALDDVHTAPPFRPTNAFSDAVEFMYVIGTVRSAATTSVSSSQQV